ncbi:MAG: metal ABC transporter permease [Phycisphaerales bacterium]
MLEILLIPFIACLILTGIHCYLGIHVLMRGVIFVDLALAQVAAMGAAVAIAAGFHGDSTAAYGFALAFTILGAGVFSLARFQEHRVPQEAVIGIVYAVTSAVTILILSRSAGERDEIEHMLVGELLFVGWPTIIKTLAIYIPVALLHVFCRRPFFAISRDGDRHGMTPLQLRAWDFLFYASFGVVVTSSVQIAGVLLVFCFLIVPAACAALFAKRVGARLVLGWAIGAGASLAGLFASGMWDLPTGPAVVAALGAAFCIAGLVYALRTLRAPHEVASPPSTRR